MSKERDKGRAAVKHLENTSKPASTPRFAAVCSCVFNTRPFSFLIIQIALASRASVGQKCFVKGRWKFVETGSLHILNREDGASDFLSM